ncbi:50S ribosomal protein L6 [Candidatus Roizmanbacteria bacterium]|nr:50S ribosomal protein L6 [Candidatus Roizmanbacteria bacterium]
MSKIGEKVIPLSGSVNLDIQGKTVTAQGSKGTLTVELPVGISIEKQEGSLRVTREKDTKQLKALHGLFRSIVFNAIEGVDKGWQKRLEITGTGFNVKMQGEDLVFKIGYSHPVIYKKVNGVSYQVEGNTKIVISGADKQQVGQVAYQIKMIRKPDAYKGKGIRYEGEFIRTKAGKKAKTA